MQIKFFRQVRGPDRKRFSRAVFNSPTNCYLAYALRLANDRPAATPEPNPDTKKAIFAANETSFQITTEKTTAKTKNMIDDPIRFLFDLILISPS